MARPWQPRLTVFAGLHEKPQVVMIARRLGTTTNAVIGPLLRVWLKFQADATAAGELAGKNRDWLDLLAGQPGFADAMEEAGWLTISHNLLALPGFDEFVSKKAVKRIENALKVAGRREAGRTDPAGDKEDIRRHTATCGDKPPVVPNEPKKRRPKTQAEVTDPRFWKFYNLYPKQHGQKNAWDEWAALAPDDALVEVILKAVKDQLTWPQWTKQNGDFIPTPAKWLAGQHWEDKPVTVRPGQPVQPVGRVATAEGQYGRKRSIDEQDPPAVPPGSPAGLF